MGPFLTVMIDEFGTRGRLLATAPHKSGGRNYSA